MTVERGLALADAGGLIALLNSKDSHHVACVEAVAQMHGRLLTTPYAFGEAMHLLARELGWAGQAGLWQLTSVGALEVASQGVTERMRQLMEHYRDLPMDLADASLLTMAEVRNLTSILSFDSDFRVYRLRDGKQLAVLP